MIRRVILAAATFAALGAAPALAQDHQHQAEEMSPANLQKLDEQAKAKGFSITHKKAIEIAMGKGVVKVHDIELEDDEHWKVEGQDEHGDHVAVELSARDGSVIKVDHD